MKRMFYIFVGFTVLISLSSQVYAYSYQSEYKNEETKLYHKLIHGYSPYYFSDEARSRYSYTADEKGHYTYGYKSKPWGFEGKMSVGMQEEEDADRGVLISKPLKESSYPLITPKDSSDVERINDSKELDRVIRASKWEFDSKKFEEAIRKKSNTVKADDSQYDTKFER